tara:strand:- start:1308 stop:1799 length:492 start_codon:yes stop_codon:yes gene_type:complete
MPQNRKFQKFVSTERLADDAVTGAKILAGTIATTDLAYTPAQSLTFRYEFDSQGGAVGAVTLTDTAGGAQQLPAGALVTSAVIKSSAALSSSGSATLALGITGTATAFKTATAFNNAAYAGSDAVTAASSPVYVSSATNVIGTIATAALEGGIVDLVLTFVVV